MLRRSALLVLLCALPAVASKKDMPPLASEVRNAKTIYIANETGNQDFADGIYEEFTKWGRFHIVETRQSADLVIVLNKTPYLKDGTTGYIYGFDVDGPSSSDVLFHAGARGLNFSWHKLAASCVKSFHERLPDRVEGSVE